MFRLSVLLGSLGGGDNSGMAPVLQQEAGEVRQTTTALCGRPPLILICVSSTEKFATWKTQERPGKVEANVKAASPSPSCPLARLFMLH